MFEVFRDDVFPFIKTLHSDENSAFSKAMKVLSFH